MGSNFQYAKLFTIVVQSFLQQDFDMESTDGGNFADMAKRYNELEAASSDAWFQKNYRLCADLARSAVNAAPSKWSDRRWTHLMCYTMMLAESNKPFSLVPNKDDVKFLSRVSRDETEPCLFRSQALFTLSTVKNKEQEFEMAAIYLRDALEMVESTTSSERRRQVTAIVNTAGTGTTTIETTTVEKELEKITSGCNRVLDVLENNAYSQSSFEAFSQRRRM